MNVHLSVAQAFHWCLDHGKAFSEFSRILNKDGAVVLLWNIDDRFASFLSFTFIIFIPLQGGRWLGCTVP
jgi:ubiquinone/menaquinone biosynthesis C-methylase UbiE